MKTIKGLIFITLLMALTLIINSTARAGVTILPDVYLWEWKNNSFEGQYGIEIDSPPGNEWYILWFAVENGDAAYSWTNREFWLTELVTQADFNSGLPQYSPEASTDVVVYGDSYIYNLIGPDEYDDSFYWSSLAPPSSRYWAGVTMLDNGNGIEEIISGVARAPDQEPIPEPATLLLLGTGLAGVGAIRRKRANKV